MKKILTLIAILLLQNISAQLFSFVKQFRSYTDYADHITKIQKDSSGNIYLLGKTLSYSGIDVDPGPNVNLLIPTNTSSSNSGTTFVIKLDNNGNYLWSYKISNMHNDLEYDLKVKNGKVYALTSKAVLQGNYINGYSTITILDYNGNLITENQVSNGTPTSLEIDNSGNIYLDTTSFTNLVFTDTFNSSFNDINSTAASYIIKFNPSMHVQWLKKITNTYNSKIVLNSNNDVYFAGNNALGNSQYTVSRFDENGNLLWSGIQQDQRFSDIIVDNNDKLIISGQWMAQFAPIDVDPSTAQHLLPSNTYISLYLLWFDTNNNLLDVKTYLN